MNSWAGFPLVIFRGKGARKKALREPRFRGIAVQYVLDLKGVAFVFNLAILYGLL